MLVDLTRFKGSVLLKASVLQVDTALKIAAQLHVKAHGSTVYA